MFQCLVSYSYYQGLNAVNFIRTKVTLLRLIYNNRMIPLLGSLLVIILSIYYTVTWFDITIVIYLFKIELTYVVIALIILLILIKIQHFRNKESSFLIFFFWVLIIMITIVIYSIYVQTFFLNNPLDYLVKSESFSIKICYSIKYRISFTKNYLMEYYAIFAEEDILIGGDLTSVISFQKAITLLPWDYIMNNIFSIEELKIFSNGFIFEYLDYNRMLANTMVTLIEEENYYNGFSYNFWRFLLNSIVILLFPAILSKLLFSMGGFHFNYFHFHQILDQINSQRFREMLFDKAFTIITERLWHYDFYMGDYLLQGVEREDFLKFFAVLLLRKFTSKEILEMAKLYDNE